MICIFLIQLEDLQNQESWYSAEEMRRYFKTNKYSDEIANELCDQYADNLQKAYEKGLSRQKIKEEHMLHFGTYMPICDYGDFLCKLDEGEFEVLSWSNEYGIYQETWTKGEEDFTERVIAFIDLPN